MVAVAMQARRRRRSAEKSKYCATLCCVCDSVAHAWPLPEHVAFIDQKKNIEVELSEVELKFVLDLMSSLNASSSEDTLAALFQEKATMEKWMLSVGLKIMELGALKYGGCPAALREEEMGLVLQHNYEILVQAVLADTKKTLSQGGSLRHSGVAAKGFRVLFSSPHLKEKEGKTSQDPPPKKKKRKRKH